MVILETEGISKRYRLGVTVSHSTLGELVARKLGSLFGREKKAKGPGEDDYIWALKDVSFKLEKGRILGIIGRNGSGKSTLLKILSRITTPTEGRVRLKGRVGSLLEVGMGFHPELTGRENIYMNGAVLGMKKNEIRRKFDEIVDFAELEKFLETPVKRYSSGMYVRLGFAVAAHLEPDILLVDEVLAVGDARFQKKCLGKMDSVARGGRTVIFVSHNMVAVQNLCHETIWLEEGKIEADGETAEVVSRYMKTASEEYIINEREWDPGGDAPGGADIKIRKIALVPAGRPGDVISMKTPLQVEVIYEKYDAESKFDITLHFVTEQGVVAFSTSSIHSGGSDRGKTGTVKRICGIPGSFLNSGIYLIKCIIMRNGSEVIWSGADVLVFEVAETVDTERVESWFGKRPGVVRPELDWKMEEPD